MFSEAKLRQCLKQLQSLVPLHPLLARRGLQGNANGPHEKKHKAYLFVAPPLVELFWNRSKSLEDSVVASLPSFLSRACASIFRSFNQVCENWSKTDSLSTGVPY
ncbi:Uncharacterized protein Fot_27690 [Forsythia ovata]|uniref:Uncharacterized protein n=1 Tax=Forsythia ovata TaxID=205694 RepID=A0ABD1TLW0_9LAMI